MESDDELGWAVSMLRGMLRAASDDIGSLYGGCGRALVIALSILEGSLNERAELDALEWLHTHRNDQIAIDEVPFAPR